MNDIDKILTDSATRFFTDLCTREIMDQAENGHWLDAAWQEICDMGLAAAASIPMDEDEIGLPLESLSGLAQLVGHYNVPLPLVETFAGQRAMLRAGIPFDETQPIGLSTLVLAPTLTLQPDRSGAYTAHGKVKRVAWGRHCPNVLVRARVGEQTCLALLPRPAHIIEASNLAGEPRDTLCFDGETIAAERVAMLSAKGDDPLMSDPLLWEAALFRAQQLAGAMHRVLDMTITYALEREQFGRPIAKFQAIQQQIAEQATQVASSTAAADAAAHASAHYPAPVPIAMAKIRSSEAATQVCAVAHQVHGAMGFTHEHMLHLSTRRLMSWRDEFGSDGHWADWFGQQLQNIDGTRLWAYITDSHAVIESLNQHEATT